MIASFDFTVAYAPNREQNSFALVHKRDLSSWLDHAFLRLTVGDNRGCTISQSSLRKPKAIPSHNFSTPAKLEICRNCSTQLLIMLTAKMTNKHKYEYYQTVPSTDKRKQYCTAGRTWLHQSTHKKITACSTAIPLAQRQTDWSHASVLTYQLIKPPASAYCARPGSLVSNAVETKRDDFCQNNLR